MALINAKGKESWLGIADLDKDGFRNLSLAKRYAPGQKEKLSLPGSKGKPSPEYQFKVGTIAGTQPERRCIYYSDIG